MVSHEFAMYFHTNYDHTVLNNKYFIISHSWYSCCLWQAYWHVNDLLWIWTRLNHGLWNIYIYNVCLCVLVFFLVLFCFLSRWGLQPECTQTHGDSWSPLGNTIINHNQWCFLKGYKCRKFSVMGRFRGWVSVRGENTVCTV